MVYSFHWTKSESLDTEVTSSWPPLISYGGFRWWMEYVGKIEGCLNIESVGYSYLHDVTRYSRPNWIEPVTTEQDIDQFPILKLLFEASEMNIPIPSEKCTDVAQVITKASVLMDEIEHVGIPQEYIDFFYEAAKRNYYAWILA